MAHIIPTLYTLTLNAISTRMVDEIEEANRQIVTNEFGIISNQDQLQEAMQESIPEYISLNWNTIFPSQLVFVEEIEKAVLRKLVDENLIPPEAYNNLFSERKVNYIVNAMYNKASIEFGIPDFIFSNQGREQEFMQEHIPTYIDNNWGDIFPYTLSMEIKRDVLDNLFDRNFINDVQYNEILRRLD
jgi:hypothetical protein